MAATATELQAIVYTRGSLSLLDQRKLPLEAVYLRIKDSKDGWQAIRDMVVRGAPAIAIAAALSLAVEIYDYLEDDGSAQNALQLVKGRLDFLVTSRPTAVNLADAAEKLKKVAAEAAATNAREVFQAVIEAAETMLADDVASNKAIGSYGSAFLLQQVNAKDKLNILTHCNTGSLATAGYGTALGVVRALHSKGRLQTTYCTETRPYNQGARLTAFELVHDGIPAVLVADSAAAALQRIGQVDAIVVGADRVAANGDTANKIGTYSLAVSAAHHGIPFCIAAPFTSIDLSMASGSDIVIEERSSTELTHSRGAQVAPDGISVWNPAFDVTPAALISAIITDKGVITKEDGGSRFNIAAFAGPRPPAATAHDSGHASQKSFYALSEATVGAYLQSLPDVAAMLGGTSKDWSIKEVGDGNLNYVYIVVGPDGSVVLKQAIPYIRCVGESWPMALDRAYYEASALKEHGRFSQDHVPEVYHFNRSMAAIVMKYLEPPHIILRKGLIAGCVYPRLADHMSDYMARTLFYTTLLARSTTEHKAAVAEFCGNVQMCRLTEQVIFTDPYMDASNNRWTTPQLDEEVKCIREDDYVKLEIAGLKAKFCERTQALIHGDLHTGSIMVTRTSTQVIDPEFAFYGPIGFDIGAFLGNLILAFCAQDGHCTQDDDRNKYRQWILSVISDSWNLFKDKFLALWNQEAGQGDAYPAEVYNSAEARKLAQRAYIREVFEDTLGFAAAKMVRRIVGIAHVEDLESIRDAELRSRCERRALRLAKELLKRRRQIASIEQVIEMAVASA